MVDLPQQHAGMAELCEEPCVVAVGLSNGVADSAKPVGIDDAHVESLIAELPVDPGGVCAGLEDRVRRVQGVDERAQVRRRRSHASLVEQLSGGIDERKVDVFVAEVESEGSHGGTLGHGR